jgi:hypothetical protein
VLTALSLMGAGLALAGSGAPHPLPGQLPGPPSVRVEILGSSLQAARGSSCWSIERDDGTAVGICADAVSPSTDEAVPARGKRMARIDAGAPAQSLTASLPGKRFREPWPVDPTHRYWMVRLPKRLEATSVLMIGARFAQGSAGYGVTLKRVKR